MALEALDETQTWVGATAKQIARAVRRGDASATEVVSDHLAHITARGDVVRAFRLLRGGEALAEADAVDAQEELINLPLAGVPVAVKENTAIAGLPTWNGSAHARTAVAAEDHEVVRRLRGAGAVVVGTTRAPELCIWPFTDDCGRGDPQPVAHRPDPGRFVRWRGGRGRLGHGPDGARQRRSRIRYGFRQPPAVSSESSRGAVSCPPRWGRTTGTGSPSTDCSPPRSPTPPSVWPCWPAGRRRSCRRPGRLRVAVSTRSPIVGVFPDAAAKAAVSSATKLLIGAGHDAIDRSPSYPTRLGLRTIATWCAAVYDDATANGLDRRELQPRTRRHIEIGRWASRHGFVQAEHRAKWRRDCEAWFGDNKVDVLLTPALATSPPAAEEFHTKSWSANMLASMRFAPYAAPWNVAGFPAMVVPMGVRTDGLPVAVQLVGPPGSELRLLAVAGQLEEASPWLRHAPGWPLRNTEPA